MNIDREFTSFDAEMNWRKRKRLQSWDADEYQGAIFSERMEESRN